jgi:trigger factor
MFGFEPGGRRLKMDQEKELLEEKTEIEEKTAAKVKKEKKEKNKKKEKAPKIELEPTAENLKRELKQYHREAVTKLVQKGALDQIDSEEELEVYRNIVSLRELKLIGIIAKKKGRLNPEWFRIDHSVYKNNAFVRSVFKKYQKSFNLNSEDVCSTVFEIALLTDDTDTVSLFIKKKKMTEKYPLLAGGSDAMFQLVFSKGIKKWDDDQIVELYAVAASAPDGQSRIRKLYLSGLDPATKNQDGLTAEEVLEEQIGQKKYTKNRAGELKRTQDQQAFRYLHKITRGDDTVEKEKNPVWKYVLIGAVIVAVTVGIICLCIAVYGTGTSEDEIVLDDDSWSEDYDIDYDYDYEDEASETSLLTDTSLVVEDGDTVNIDYTGYIDEVAFDGGSTDGYGTDLVIGSGSYIDDFEEQLIGHNVGDTVSVEVTFPDDYGVDDLNGKDAVFEVTINGIYE